MTKYFRNISALLFLIVTANCVAEDNRNPAGMIPLSGKQAPILVLKDMDGNAIDLKQSRGRWAFVHFWATWCGPCRREMPTIHNMSEKMKGTNLDILLVNTAEDDEKVFGFLGIVAPELNSLMDYDGLTTEKWQPRGLPSTFLVGPKGKLRYLALGGRKWDSPEFLAFLKRIIKQGN